MKKNNKAGYINYSKKLPATSKKVNITKYGADLFKINPPAKIIKHPTLWKTFSYLFIFDG